MGEHWETARIAAKRRGVSFYAVPYKTQPQNMLALVANETDLTITAINTAAPQPSRWSRYCGCRFFFTASPLAGCSSASGSTGISMIEGTSAFSASLTASPMSPGRST